MLDKLRQRDQAIEDLRMTVVERDVRIKHVEEEHAPCAQLISELRATASELEASLRQLQGEHDALQVRFRKQGALLQGVREGGREGGEGRGEGRGEWLVSLDCSS